MTKDRSKLYWEAMAACDDVENAVKDYQRAKANLDECRRRQLAALEAMDAALTAPTKGTE